MPNSKLYLWYLYACGIVFWPTIRNRYVRLYIG